MADRGSEIVVARLQSLTLKGLPFCIRPLGMLGLPGSSFNLFHMEDRNDALMVLERKVKLMGRTSAIHRIGGNDEEKRT
jgi:hypothetical protein